jgi:rhodanese-related sulfurtransferase
MNWKSLFSFAESLTPSQVQVYLKNHRADTYQLLDVRQPVEYEREHLPGAILLPVKELIFRVGELDPHMTTLVYCSNGVRSKPACQFLLAHDFQKVLNLAGGIRAWNGIRLSGTEARGVEFFASGEFEDAFQMAYRMEAGLKQFYLVMAEKVDVLEQQALLVHMASFEDGHMAKLRHQHREGVASIPEKRDTVSFMEGGFDKEKTLGAYASYIESMEDIIHLGMMFEMQAYDLYSRLARKEENPRTREFYYHMAEEEKLHLGQLSRELDKILAGQNPAQALT